MTKDSRIRTAAEEARRFLARVEARDIAIAKAEKEKIRLGSRWSIDTPIENGALTRASMDLTRALAALRRPN